MGFGRENDEIEHLKRKGMNYLTCYKLDNLFGDTMDAARFVVNMNDDYQFNVAKIKDEVAPALILQLCCNR
uniref:Uncharacterized protein n=1 Tax=Cucumis melo TaxID=3656 RepID=A0A9I9E8U2_CUCME